LNSYIQVKCAVILIGIGKSVDSDILSWAGPAAVLIDCCAQINQRRATAPTIELGTKKARNERGEGQLGTCHICIRIGFEQPFDDTRQKDVPDARNCDRRFIKQLNLNWTFEHQLQDLRFSELGEIWL
jgi:hypothetical protein